MAESPLEYRVVWKREGCRKKVQVFATRQGAERQLARLGPEPWTAYGKQPDALRCCKGYGCGCDGLTEREWAAHLAEAMPPLEFVRLESRPALAWTAVAVPAPTRAGGAG